MSKKGHEAASRRPKNPRGGRALRRNSLLSLAGISGNGAGIERFLFTQGHSIKSKASARRRSPSTEDLEMEPDYFHYFTHNSPGSLTSFMHSKTARRMLLTALRKLQDDNRSHPDVHKIDPWTLLPMQRDSDQAIKARRPRGKLDSGLTIRELVTELLSLPENRDAGPAELWPRFFAQLDEQGARPKEVGTARARCYSYEWAGSERRTMTLHSFSNLIRTLRKTLAY